MEGKIEKRKRERKKSLYPGHQRVKYSEMMGEKRDGEHCPGLKWSRQGAKRHARFLQSFSPVFTNFRPLCLYTDNNNLSYGLIIGQKTSFDRGGYEICSVR